MLTITSRRRFLLGAGALIAAPSIVRAQSLMPVSVVEVSEGLTLDNILRAKSALEANEMTATELVALQQRWADAALELTRRVLENGALKPPTVKWFAAGADFANGLASVTRQS